MLKQKNYKTSHKISYVSHTIKAICVSTCPYSNSLLFYHSTTKQVISATDANRFDPSLPSGPQFNLKFDSALSLTRKSQIPLHQPPAHELGTSCFVEQGDKYVNTKVLSIPIDDDNDTYKVQLANDEIAEFKTDQLHDHNPTIRVKNEKGHINSPLGKT